VPVLDRRGKDRRRTAPQKRRGKPPEIPRAPLPPGDEMTDLEVELRICRERIEALSVLLATGGTLSVRHAGIAGRGIAGRGRRRDAR
jgi:hypothetical protein